MCAKKGKYNRKQLHEEIQEIGKNAVIRDAAENVRNMEMAEYIRKKKHDRIEESIWRTVKKDKWKNRLKEILFSIKETFL